MSVNDPATTPLGAGSVFAARYEVLRPLGSGSNGIVYAVRDRKTALTLALKTLSSPDASTLYQLKNEFRSLSGIRHENLVELYELHIDDDSCFFTMELVEGTDFFHHVRPDGRIDERRLRSGLIQLCSGLAALHATGKLHRDVKPSNVLVTGEGRVVLLDFGLATDLHSNVSRESRAGEIVGTVAYMAPEQLWEASVSPKSDCYSLGVMLYECLTGRMPVSGTQPESALRPRSFRPLAPSALSDDVPPDLDAAAMALLDPEPPHRPAAHELPMRLRSDAQARPRRSPAPSSSDAASHPADDPRFVGRFEELARLQRAFSAVIRGEPVLARLCGPSGMGKTALVEHLLATVEAESGALTLRARCQPHETVPFNAIDGLVDQLSSYLKGRSRAELLYLTPHHIADLVRLFPVLGRVEFPSQAGEATKVPHDPYEVRRRAEAALRDLLGRVSRLVPLVLWVDDVQWGDLSSASILRTVLRQPGAPALLLLLAYRSEDRERNALLQAIEAEDLEASIDLAVGPLDTLDARALADALLPRATGSRRPALVDEVARESRGSPFLIGQLAQSLPADATGGLGPAPGVDHVVRRRLARLSHAEQRLLAVVAVSPAPLPIDSALRAAELDPSDLPLVSRLAHECMLRLAVGDAGERAVEPYHERIREVLLADLGPDERRHWHAALVAILREDEVQRPAVLAHHLFGAGEVEAATACAERAADDAQRAFAFMRAAELYRLGATWSAADASRATRLQVSQADALVKAGRCADAADIYLQAAAGASAEASRSLRGQAVAQLLVSGRIDEGVGILRPLLRHHRVRYPRVPRAAMAASVARLVAIAARGLRSERWHRSGGDPSVRELADLCYLAGRGLAHVDSARAAHLALIAVTEALRTGDPERAARCLSLAAPMLGSAPGWIGAWGRKFLDEAERIASQRGEAHLGGVVMVGRAVTAMLEGEWKRALELGERSFGLLKERGDPGRAVGWECNIARMVTLRALEDLGRYDEEAERAAEFADEARICGDRWGAIVASGYASHAALAKGLGAEALAPLRQAFGWWSQDGFHIQHFYSLRVEVTADLYEGAPARAWDRLQRAWGALERAHLLDFVMPGIDAYVLRGRVALRVAAADDPAARRRLDVARADARRVARMAFRGASHHAAVLEAGIAALTGQPERAIGFLDDAIRGFEAGGQVVHAASARRARARLGRTSRSEDDAATADAQLVAAGVADPARWAETLCPIP